MSAIAIMNSNKQLSMQHVHKQHILKITLNQKYNKKWTKNFININNTINKSTHCKYTYDNNNNGTLNQYKALTFIIIGYRFR